MINSILRGQGGLESVSNFPVIILSGVDYLSLFTHFEFAISRSIEPTV
jgi:hypothetical protein